MSTAPEVWRAVFGNAHPVEVEIGPGRGDVVLAFASARPDTNFFAIERSPALAEAVTARIASLPNVRILAGDARCILERLIPPSSVTAVHIYFPDPWPKTRHRGRRLFAHPEVARSIVRALVPGGVVHVASDLPALHDTMRARLAAAGLVETATPPPGRPVSKFERKYATAGTHAVTFIKPG